MCSILPANWRKILRELVFWAANEFSALIVIGKLYIHYDANFEYFKTIYK